MYNFQNYIDNFLITVKKILKEQISKNPITLEGYKKELVGNYNKLIIYTSENYGRCNLETQKEVVIKLEKIRIKLNNCFVKLNIKYNFTEDLFEQIDLDNFENLDCNKMALTSIDFQNYASIGLFQNLTVLHQSSLDSWMPWS